MSKTTDKLMLINDMVERLPVNKIKTINVVWKEVDGITVPDMLIEMFETAEEANDEKI